MIRSEAFAKALPVIAGFITARTGIPIVRGKRAETNGERIILPKLPDLRLTMRDVVRVVAYVYHECFHILWSNFELDSKALPPLEQALAGVLEDIRIEHLGIARFPAARKYLGRLVEVLTEDGLAGEYPCFKARTVQDHEAKILQSYMLYRLRHDVLNQVSIAPALAPTAKAADAKFPRGMMVRLDALMFQVLNCESEDDVFALAAEIASMIKEEKEKENEHKKQEPPKQQHEKSGDGEEGQDQAAGSDSDAEKDVADEAALGDLEELVSMGQDEVEQTLDEMLEEIINQTAAELVGQGVSMPNVHPLKLANKAADMGKVKGSINAIRTKTLQWMSSAAETDVQHARSGEMLDFSRLHAAKLGGEIFVRQDEGIDLNAAVSIVVDRSGSMKDIIGQAANAALAAMMAFDVPGISTQVSVFPVYSAEVPGIGLDEGVGVVKRWEESPRHLASRIASLDVDGGTPMAEAILFASSDIQMRQESLRIVLVVTDGYPDNFAATREVIEAARASGVAVVGLGIGIDPSKVFGDRYAAQVVDVQQLSGAMVKLIKSSMSTH